MSVESNTTTRDTIVVDAGPVANAARILVTTSTLAQHVTATATPGVLALGVIEIEKNEDIPFELWGSGTQALWRLLEAIAYTSEAVSLYEVVSHLDVRNRHAVANALAAFCEVAR